MNHKILTPSYARELYARHTMEEIQAAYNISWLDLAYMLLHGKEREE